MKAIIDIETSGWSKEKNGICEIGLIIIDDQCEVISQYSVLIKPYERENSPELVSYKDSAMEVHGITIDMLNNNGLNPHTACDCIEVVLGLHGVDVFIGHCIDTFDRPWLNYFFERFNNAVIVFNNTEDTMRLAKESIPGLKSYSLKSLCEHFGITNHSAHRAMGDCMATLEVYKKLKGV